MHTENVLSVMHRKKCDEQELFLVAYMYIYGTTADVSNDVAQFKLHCITPFYVLKYVEMFIEADI